LEKLSLSFLQEVSLLESAIMNSRRTVMSSKKRTLETDVLAENLFSIYTDWEADWLSLEVSERERWFLMAEYVLDREASLTTKRGHQRALKRQIERLTLKYRNVKD
jgi:hypothetical protein